MGFELSYLNSYLKGIMELTELIDVKNDNQAGVICSGKKYSIQAVFAAGNLVIDIEFVSFVQSSFYLK
jgi:hypothetical protein